MPATKGYGSTVTQRREKHPGTYDHDCQAAEDDREQFFGIIRLAYNKSGFFIRMAPPTFRAFYTYNLPAMGGCIFSLISQ